MGIGGLGRCMRRLWGICRRGWGGEGGGGGGGGGWGVKGDGHGGNCGGEGGGGEWMEGGYFFAFREEVSDEKRCRCGGIEIFFLGKIEET